MPEQDIPSEILVQILGDCIVDEFDLTVSPEIAYTSSTTMLSQSFQVSGWPDFSAVHLNSAWQAFPILRKNVMTRARDTALDHFSGRLIIKPGVDQLLVNDELQPKGILYCVRSSIKILVVEHEVTNSSILDQYFHINYDLLGALRQVICIGTGNLKPSTQPSRVEDVEGCVLDFPSQMHRGAGAAARDVVLEMKQIDKIPSPEYLHDHSIELTIYTYQRDRDYWPWTYIWIHQVDVSGENLTFKQISRIRASRASDQDVVRAKTGIERLRARQRFADMMALAPASHREILLQPWRIVSGNNI